MSLIFATQKSLSSSTGVGGITSTLRKVAINEIQFVEEIYECSLVADCEGVLHLFIIRD